jgi:hypothetical protein
MEVNSLKNIMKSFVLITMLALCSYAGLSQTQKVATSPLEVVNQRMDFYNHHDFEKFIRLYSDSVKVYTYPDKFLAAGKDNLASIFKPKFSSKSIQVKIITQINNGNYVINQEVVTENGMDTKYVSIYEVKDGLIFSVRFVRD